MGNQIHPRKEMTTQILILKEKFLPHINRKSLIPTSLEIFEHLKWS